MQGLRLGFSAHCFEWIRPSRSMKIASPGATSRVSAWPVPTIATDSLATITSGPSGPSPSPNESGRMPYGSRNASRPWPAISATTAYEPLMRRCTALTAAKISSGVSCHSRAAPSSSCASTLISTSVSLPVLMCRRSTSNSSCFSAWALVRLPLCTRTMP